MKMVIMVFDDGKRKSVAVAVIERNGKVTDQRLRHREKQPRQETSLAFL
jgi:hypothetical protein